MPRPVVADADVLFAGTTRAFLIYLDFQRVIHLHWSPLILKEAHDALVDTGRKTRAEAEKHMLLLDKSLPGASVPTLEVQASYRLAYPGVSQPKDLHVAACAAALLAGRYYADPEVWLVTKNGADFRTKVLTTLGIKLRHPDTFLLELWNNDPVGVAAAFHAMRLRLKSKPTVNQLLDKLARDSQHRIAAALLAAHVAGSAAL